MKHKFNPQRPQPLSDEDFTKFEEALDYCYAHEEYLKGAELTFVNDLYDRHGKYGRATFVSLSQLEWLMNIASKLGD
jgi:hypothetical protein